MIGNVAAVFLFEWKRSLTVPRMAWWLVLAGFPVFIIGLIRFSITAGADATDGLPSAPPRELWIGFLFALVPMLVTMLGTMLWMTPAISAELERRSWVYLTVRPNGGTAVLLGKYLAAVTWVIPPVLLGLTCAIVIISPNAKEAEEIANAKKRESSNYSLLVKSQHGQFQIPSAMDVRDLKPWQIWWAMTRMVCLSAPAYAAVYLFLGTIMPRRGMVLAVGYSLLFELIISFVPAVINKLTVHHHLQALMLEWCELEIPPEFMSGAASLIGNSPTWHHIAILMLYPPILLAISVAVLRSSEFSSSAESDV